MTQDTHTASGTAIDRALDSFERRERGIPQARSAGGEVMRLRWKLKPRKTGLMAIGAGQRGSVLHDGKITFATVIAHIPEHTGRTEWLWVAGWDSDVPYYNSCNYSGLTEAEAKAAAMAYVKKHLARLEGKSHDNT